MSDFKAARQRRRDANRLRIPNNTYYGDGSPIESDVMDHLRQAYLKEKILFPWQQFDVLMVDNMLASHAREPFSGNRRVVTGMADPHFWKECLPHGFRTGAKLLAAETLR